MSSDDRDEKIKQLELKLKDLEIEKDEKDKIIQEKSDNIVMNYFVSEYKSMSIDERDLKSCGRDPDLNFSEVRESNNDKISKQITCQYVQKELILDIASWISPEFYFKCNEIVMNYFLRSIS